MLKSFYTHRVAVNGYVIRDGKFLLLKRNTPPFIWAPPGGRLEKDEEPHSGLKREIMEETHFEIEIVATVGTWFGNWRGDPLLSIDYLTKIVSGELKLSLEHTDSAWVSLEDLRNGKPVVLDPDIGFTLKDFEQAWKLHLLLQN